MMKKKDKEKYQVVEEEGWHQSRYMDTKRVDREAEGRTECCLHNQLRNPLTHTMPTHVSYSSHEHW